MLRIVENIRLTIGYVLPQRQIRIANSSQHSLILYMGQMRTRLAQNILPANNEKE